MPCFAHVQRLLRPVSGDYSEMEPDSPAAYRSAPADASFEADSWQSRRLGGIS